uniref:V-set and transmembrane domain containing 5 n=1 Tax=Ovis aries TaxID=9940 RepID=A0AC11EPL1_SHEEP
GGRTRSRGLSLGVLALCVAAARCLQSQGVSLYIPQPAINATVEEDILLSVDYSCHGIPTIEWKYTSSWGVQKIVEWKPGTQANISQSHKDRVCTFDNGSIQLFSVGVRDSGSYIITVTERLGSSQFGTIVLHVSGSREDSDASSLLKAEYVLVITGSVSIHSSASDKEQRESPAPAPVCTSITRPH